MENRGYFFIDGSHLLSSIFSLWRNKPEFKGKKADIRILTESLMRKWSLYVGSTVRIVYYFKKNEERLKTLLNIPETTKPGVKDHWQIKESGQNIKNKIPQEELEKINQKYRDHFIRSEKGLDIKLACDALILIATGRVSNLVFLVNDRDYIPLFEAIQHLGGNVYLTALDSTQYIQKDLVNLADKYLTLNDELNNIFDIKIKPEQEPQQKL